MHNLQFARNLGVAFQILNDLGDWNGDDHNKLAAGLDAAKAWADAAAIMTEAIAQYPFGTDGMRIRLATILAGRLDRPQEALDVLDGLDPEMLSAEEGALAERVSRKAREMIAKRPPAP